ncbi:hypothetical protein BaRGS_00021490 [Batillaria attramentaria]|uniref:RING-type domain-containing protein n=1 Tax=Batillaria attramentaria TaxID=370345 RepID=A0ABD0KJL0_9CAEN
MAGRTQFVSALRRRKANKPLASSVFGGASGSFEDRDNHYVCPVCFDIIDEAHMTKCGHSFCHKCIKQSLEKSNRCPKCNYVIENPEQIYPNFTLNELIMKFKSKQTERKRKIDQRAPSSGTTDLSELLSDEMDLPNINYLLEVLSHKKQKMEADGQFAESCILKEFLQQVRQRKQVQLDQLQREIGYRSCRHLALDLLRLIYADDVMLIVYCCLRVQDHLVPNGFDPAQATSTILDAACDEAFNSSAKASGSTSHSQKSYLQTSLAQRRKKISLHFEDLEHCYLNIRTSGLKPGPEGGGKELDDFTNCLSKFTRYSSFRPLATLSYAVDLFNGSSSIVSSIEFDRDCDFFAIAGVTKKIKVYEYETVIKDAVDIHYPTLEMLCQSKISCVAWSSYHKGGLASSDYEGTVSLWDANTGSRVKLFQEHEKRCWSVDYNRMDPRLLASGSDDCKVKLWSSNVDHSIASLEAKANVCCVKFNPESRFHLAFGSADHCVHYYDLRHTRQPVGVFRGHKKAVSYVKFLSNHEVVSASTDSQLKLWDLKRPNAICTFTGHTNEKNFVGLATDGDYVACGSENNSLYMYYKGLAKQIMTYKFDTVRSVLEKERKDDETSEFVSAVTWKPGSNVLVAANSQGTVKVLEIV